MKSLVRLAVPAALCFVAAAGCNRDRERAGVDLDRDRPGTVMEEERTGTTTVTGANVVSSQSAIDRIVAARCSREAACNNIGADKDYTDRNACMQKLRTDMRDDLGAKECPAGIDQKELDECLTEINNNDCNNPLDSIGRLAACRSSDLCKNVR